MKESLSFVISTDRTENAFFVRTLIHPKENVPFVILIYRKDIVFYVKIQIYQKEIVSFVRTPTYLKETAPFGEILGIFLYLIFLI